MPKRSPESVDRDPADILIADLENLFQVVQDQQQATQEPVDYSAALNSESWQAAPEAVKRKLADRYGFAIPENPESPETDEPLMPIVPQEFAYDFEAEREKRGGKAIGRLFVGYQIESGPNGEITFKEKGYQGNGKKYDELRNPKPSQIEISEELRARMNEPVVRTRVLDFCNRLRKHLETGLNIEPDRNKHEDGRLVMDPGRHWNLKWKYGVDADNPNRRPLEDRLAVGDSKWKQGQKLSNHDLGQVPWNIYQLVEDALDGRASVSGPELGTILKKKGDQLYHGWYKESLFGKRDQVISEHLAKQQFEKLPTSVTEAESAPVSGSEPEPGSAPEPEPAADADTPAALTPAPLGKQAIIFARAGLRAARRTIAATEKPAVAELAPEPVPASEPQSDVPEPEPAAAPEKPKLVSPEQIRQDAQPLITPLLDAWMQIKAGDREAQLSETTNSVVRELAKSYHTQQQISADDEAQLRELKQVVQAAVEAQLRDKDGYQVELAADNWHESIREQVAGKVEQAASALNERVSDEQKRKLVAGMTAMFAHYEKTFWSVVDFQNNRFTLRNLDDLQQYLQDNLKKLSDSR
jgi:hypothetical protein